MSKLSRQMWKDHDCESVDVLCNQRGNRLAQRKFLCNCEVEGEGGEERKGRMCVKRLEYNRLDPKLNGVHRTQTLQ